MASLLQIPMGGRLEGEDYDGSIFIYAEVEVELYDLETRTLLDTVMTDEDGFFPDTEVDLDVGAGVLIAAAPVRGIPGSGLFYTVPIPE